MSNSDWTHEFSYSSGDLVPMGGSGPARAIPQSILYVVRSESRGIRVQLRLDEGHVSGVAVEGDRLDRDALRGVAVAELQRQATIRFSRPMVGT